MAYTEQWKVKYVTVQPGVKADPKKLKDALTDGWEPFAVTWDGHAFDYHLRKFFYESVEED